MFYDYCIKITFDVTSVYIFSLYIFQKDDKADIYAKLRKSVKIDKTTTNNTTDPVSSSGSSSDIKKTGSARTLSQLSYSTADTLRSVAEIPKSVALLPDKNEEAKNSYTDEVEQDTQNNTKSSSFSRDSSDLLSAIMMLESRLIKIQHSIEEVKRRQTEMAVVTENMNSKMELLESQISDVNERIGDICSFSSDSINDNCDDNNIGYSTAL